MPTPRSMLRKIASLFAFATLGLSAAFVSSSCADQEEAIIILGMPVFIDPEAEGLAAAGCGAEAGGEEWLAGMEVDVSYNTELIIPIEFQNNLLPAPAEATNAMIDQSEIKVTSLDVSIRFPQLPQIEEQIRADDERYLEFNLPLPTDSVGGGVRKIVFAQIPGGVLARQSQALAIAGLTDGSRIVALYTFRLKALRVGSKLGSFGEVQSREFVVPVHTGYNNLRSCVTTLWTDEETELTYDLCSPANCASPQVYRNSICGSAQLVPQLPRCCDGSANWEDNPNALLACGITP